MKKLFLPLFFAFFISKAQVTNYTLSDYKYRTEGLKAIGFSINTGSSLHSGSASLNSGNIASGLIFTKQYSKDDKQLTLWNRTGAGIGKLAGNSNPTQFSFAEQVDWVQRHYKGDNFIEFGSNSMASIYNGTYKNKKPVYNLGLNPTMGIGTGRLEYVSNAQMALFILDDLKDAGKIKGIVSNEKVDDFVKLITLLYNDRIFDYRKRRNYEVVQIENYLRTNKIITVSDIEVYNIIADNWNYSIQPSSLESTYFNSGSLQVDYKDAVTDRINQFGVLGQPRRYAGTQTSLTVDVPSSLTTSNSGLMNGFLNSTSLLIDDSTVKNVLQTNKGIGANLTWERHTPLSLKLQRILSFGAAFGNSVKSLNLKYNTNKPDSIYTEKLTGYSVFARCDYGFYPNSRTVLYASGDLYAGNSIQRFLGAATLKGMTISASAFLRAEYFINEQSRLNATVELYGSPVNPTAAARKVNLSFQIGYHNYLF
ncbi:MAG: hypothetical protein NTW54_13305 [Bacteroidetes bacterium]|nr:hypothetical protein [Bacteroidota bacterium]